MRKLVFLFVVIGALSLGMISCEKDEDNEKVTAVYSIALGAGVDEHVGSDAPCLTVLRDYIGTELYKARIALYDTTESGFYYVEITGKGDTREKALADADRQAMEKYTAWEAAANTAIADLKAKFEAKRKALASEILSVDARYYVKREYAYFLQRYPITETDDYVMLKQTEPVKVEALGGTQY